MADRPFLDDSPPVRHQGAKRCVCVVSAVFFVLLIIAAIIVLTMLLLVVGRQSARVQTTCGPVDGNFDPIHKVFTFRGLPYAKPPMGVLRWTRPQPRKAPCWDHVFQANQDAQICVQSDPINGKITGHEDCLYVNVFTPSVDPMTPLPVMVYFHGGYLQFGDNHTPGYSPNERITSKLNMVFVSVQYRLGAHGFLVSSALPGGKGNYGIWDQVAALEWVRDNIRGFGGDPSQVTIFGQSSGGTSVWVHLMSPHSKGLFNRAWIISGSPIFNKTLADSIQETDDWLLTKPVLANKCPEGKVTATCLRDLDVEVVSALVYPEWNITMDAGDLPTKGYFEPALLVVDGDLVPDVPFKMWQDQTGNYSDVPVIIGTTSQELDLNPSPGKDLLSWSEGDLWAYTHFKLGPFGHNITNTSLAMYQDGHNQYDPEHVFTTMATDIRITCGNDVMSDVAVLGLTSDVFRYVVTSYPSQPVHAFDLPLPSKYAFHGWDTYAFFDSIDQIISIPSSKDKEFTSYIQNNIEHFVKTGKPLDTRWKPYPNATALIDSPTTIVPAYHKEECAFWLKHQFWGYSWIN